MTTKRKPRIVGLNQPWYAVVDRDGIIHSEFCASVAEARDQANIYSTHDNWGNANDWTDVFSIIKLRVSLWPKKGAAK